MKKYKVVVAWDVELEAEDEDEAYFAALEELDKMLRILDYDEVFDIAVVEVKEDGDNS